MSQTKILTAYGTNIPPEDEINKKICDLGEGWETVSASTSVSVFGHNPNLQIRADETSDRTIPAYHAAYVITVVVKSVHPVPVGIIHDLRLSVRTQNCLSYAKIFSIQHLCTQTPSELLKIRGMGKRLLQEIMSKLSERGLSLRPEP